MTSRRVELLKTRVCRKVMGCRWAGLECIGVRFLPYRLIPFRLIFVPPPHLTQQRLDPNVMRTTLPTHSSAHPKTP